MPWEGRKVGVMSVVRGSLEGSQVAEEVLLPGAAEVLRRALMPDAAIDEALAQAADGGVALTGEGGFLPELVKAVLERGLAVELDDHLGYVKGDPAGRGRRTPGTGSRRRRCRPRWVRCRWRCRGTVTGRSSPAWCRRGRGARVG